MVLLKDSKIHTLDKDKQIALLMQENERLKSRQKYGLVWEDHAEELDNKNVIPLLDLREDLSLPKIEGKPDNYLIEGDNYHALKALQHTHKGLVDVIYIDPPYNTGNQDFVYNDKMVDSDDGFRHSKWLSFMEKRLILARNLMTDEGVIFVSIDDNEQAQLKLLMDNIFGERNLIETFIWERTTHYGRQAKNTYRNVEYVLCYAKSKIDNSGEIKNLLVDSVQDVFEDAPLYNGSNPTGTLLFKKGEVQFNMKDGNYLKGVRGEYELLDDVLVKDGVNMNSFELKFKSRWSQNKLDEQVSLGGKSLVKTDSFAIRFIYGARDVHLKAVTKFLNYKYGTNQGASRMIEDIFGEKSFDYSKPTSLIQYLIKTSTWNNKNAIILDFFSGSGTTAQSVLELNKEDGGNRSFIMCTNNEVSEENERNYLHSKNLIPKSNKTEYNKYRKDNPEDYDDFLNSKEYQELGIARAVTRERIKRVIEGYTTPKGLEVEGIPNNLTYLQTEEFDKIDIDGRNRKKLVALALNSHKIKYSEDKYETVVVDALFDIEDYVVKDKSKELVFFLDFRDTSSINEITTDIYEKFGKHVLTERFENYYDAERGR